VLIGFGDDADAAAAAVELDDAIDQREEREIFALPDAAAGMEGIANLTNEDIASHDRLAGEPLDAAALPGGIATVAAGALTFFMSHFESGGRAQDAVSFEPFYLAENGLVVNVARTQVVS
jgi:hypothetical protein